MQAWLCSQTSATPELLVITVSDGQDLLSPAPLGSRTAAERHLSRLDWL
jgi:hypothetical protein